MRFALRTGDARLIRMPTQRTVFKLSLALVLSLFAIASVGCLRAGSVEVTGVVNQANALGLGGSDDGILVTFIEVTSDSRCAEGVQCVVAGKADVKLGISVNSAPESEVTLEVVHGQETTYRTGKYTVKITRLLPDPPPVGGVPQDGYQLEMSITKS